MNEIEKKLDEYYASSNVGKTEICKECWAERKKSFYERNEGVDTKPVKVWFVGDSFEKQKKKILFVGKNARGKPFEDERHYRCSRYLFSTMKWAYWSYTRKICEKIKTSSLEDRSGAKKNVEEFVAFTNIVKCNDSNARDTTMQNTKEKCICEMKVLRNEIKIIEPNIIIFYTANDYEFYDYVFDELYDDSYNKITSFSKKEIEIGKKRIRWTTGIGNIGDREFHILITGHPERKKKEPFVNNIANWINELEIKTK